MNGKIKTRMALMAAAILATGNAAAFAADGVMKFDLGGALGVDGYTTIAPGATYEKGKWGFTNDSRPTVVAGGGKLTAMASDKPFYFSGDVAEGNYRVTVTVGNPKAASTTSILAQSRRLMIEKVETAAGKFKTVSFVVNVRDSKVPPPPTNAPGGSEVRLNRLDNPVTWADTLVLQFANTSPSVSKIEIEPVTVPTIFLMGDSTVTDQPRDPGASWGQMLPAFFDDKVAVANHATSGETMKSSITGLRLEKVLSQIKPGDYLIMQFGHNDEKKSWPQTYVEPETTFKAYAAVFIAEARRHGATPVLVSMMERRSGMDGNSHGTFPEAYKQVAAEQKVVLIDNWASSKILYKAMGEDVAAAFGDATHHKNYGAYEIAKLVATGLRQNDLEIAKHLRPEFKNLDPAHPDPLSSFPLPAGSGGIGAGRGPATQ